MDIHMASADTTLVEIEAFDAWRPDLDAVAPQSVCMRLEAPSR